VLVTLPFTVTFADSTQHVFFAAGLEEAREIVEKQFPTAVDLTVGEGVE
jgi:hypothetical protein